MRATHRYLVTVLAVAIMVMGMANLAADNLIAALGFGPRAGQPPNLLNPDALAVPRTSA